MKTPTGISLHKESTIRDCRSGDNWCITWAGDGHQYTSMDDGYGWQEEKDFNTRVWRIQGGPDHSGDDPFCAEFLPGFPEYLQRGGWYGYGIIAVDDILYNFVTRAAHDRWSGPFQGAKLLYSPDFGKTWLRHDGQDASIDRFSTEPETMFFWHEDADWAFSQMDFVQHGQNNSLAKDEYVYLYSPNGRRPHQLNLARVPHDRILDRSAYRFFIRHNADGSAQWTEESDIHQRGTVHVFPENWGWYSWLPKAVYNPGLDCYIMTTGGTERMGDSWMHDSTGSLGFYWAKTAWGPWTELYYEADWFVDDERNRLYQPTLSPKWISPDGTEMILIFSDAQSDEQGQSHTVNYRWNQHRIAITVEQN